MQPKARSMGEPLTRAGFVSAGAAALACLGSAKRLSNPSMHRDRRVRFGVNYVPPRQWWYLWQDWNLDDVRRDLHDIAALGMDHIRIQLLWPQFQPNTHYVSSQNIARLVALLDAAGEALIDVEVTVLDGQLSGFLFVPPFLVDNSNGHIRNFITDPNLIAAQQSLFKQLARAVARHPRFLGFDIANEIYWFTQPLHVDFSPAQGDAWMAALLTHCERVAPGRFHVNGVDKWPYERSQAQGFTRRALAASGSASVVHPWAGFSPVFSKYGPLSIESTHYAEFFVQYLQAFSASGSRTIWIEEDGCSKAWMREDLIPEWAERSIRNAASCDRLFGITWWCSHDVNPRLSGFNRLEYDLGLYTNDRKLKPLGKRIATLIAQYDRTPPPVMARQHAMIVADNAGADDIFERYARIVRDGIRPQIVLQSRSTDRIYLAERGITALITEPR